MTCADQVLVDKNTFIELLEVVLARGEKLHGYIEADASWRAELASLRLTCEAHGPVYQDSAGNLRCYTCQAFIPGA